MKPPLLLNHLYRVVDTETFEAARHSSWLREVFAPSEIRTTNRPDWSYTGLYFYGTTTYLELFEQGAQGPAGTSGLAFGIEQAGTTPAVAEAWRAALGDAETRVVVRPLGEDAMPWFHIAHAVPDRRDRLHLWSMEYHADFLAGWHPEVTEARGITRRDVLDRYARVSGGPAAPLLDDVMAVSLALSVGERTFLEQHVAAFDAMVRDAGEATYVEGEAVTIGLAAATDTRRGVQDLVCRLRRPVGRETLTLGRLTISTDGDRCVWKFR